MRRERARTGENERIKRSAPFIRELFLEQRVAPSPFVRSALLSQVRTNGSATNHSRRSTRASAALPSYKPINPIGRISEGSRVLHREKPCVTRTNASIHTHTHVRKARLREGLFRGRAQHRQEEREYRENTRTKRKEVGSKGDALCTRVGAEGWARGGEGDAARLINRHADNHSGFMVTTDYQVVQGGIFHIRDVTLFQWGNTCSARYKLHERAYTRRHVCCVVSALVGTPPCMCVCACVRSPAHSRIKMTSSGRPPGAPFFSFHLHPLPCRRSRLKIIPTFNDYKNARLLFRENDPLTDHHRRPIVHRLDISAHEIRARDSQRPGRPCSWEREGRRDVAGGAGISEPLGRKDDVAASDKEMRH